MSQTFGPDAQVLNAGSTVASAPAQTATGNEIPAMSNIAALPFTGGFTSSPQVITIGGPLALPHSLGAIPKIIDFRLVCIVADNGWAIGDEVYIKVGFDVTGTSTHGAGASADATNINVRYAATSITGYNKSSGASVNLTVSRWRLVVRAWV